MHRLLLMLMAIAAAGDASGAESVTFPGQVIVPADAAIPPGSGWQKTPPSGPRGFSDRGRLRLTGVQHLPDAPAAQRSDRLRFRFRIERPGAWQVYALASGFDGDSDSAYFEFPGLSDQRFRIGGRATDVAEVLWHRVAELPVSRPGEYTVQLSNREPGYFVSRLVIVQRDGVFPRSFHPERARLTLTGDHYRDLYRLWIENAILSRAADRWSPRYPLSNAWLAWELWRVTGETRYRDFAPSVYDERLAPAAFDPDFHHSRPFGMLTLQLERDGQLRGPRRERARRRAAMQIDWFLERRPDPGRLWDNNIALADHLAVAALVRAFSADAQAPGRQPELPPQPVAEVREQVERLLRRIHAVGDLNEDAANYSSLGICFLIELETLEGGLDALGNSESFRRMLRRQRQLLSPAGMVPEFGDSYFHPREVRLDLALLLETAARRTGDGSLRAAARIAAPRDRLHIGHDQAFRGHGLLSLAPEAPPASVHDPPSQLTQRRYRDLDRPGRPVVNGPDKLVLRAGAGSGGRHMMLIDLHARGSHAHRYKRPSVGYYEAAGVPLFHNLGRHGTRSPQCGNSFWLMPDRDDFPGYPREGQWNTMTIPASYCYPGMAAGHYRIGRDLLLRSFPNPDTRWLYLDNLRLEGPRGTLLIDGFESPESWHPNVSRHPGVVLQTSRDRTQGEGAQCVNWHVFREQYCTRLHERQELRQTTFRLADYDRVKLDYKYEGRHPHCSLRSLLRDWIDLGSRVLHTEVRSAQVGERGDDAWGRVEFADYGGAGNRLRRQLVLTAEGVLVVVDRLLPSAAADGWSGGQLWQLYTLDQRGPDWFAAASDGLYPAPGGGWTERRMLVKHLADDGAVVGHQAFEPPTMHAERTDGVAYSRFFTTYSLRPLRRGQPCLAALAVLPLRPDEPPAGAASRVRLSREEDQVRVSINRDGRQLTITVGPDRSTVAR